jgi:dihydroorotate dehydrogenase
MGFNNVGAVELAARLARLHWRPGPVGVNLGKNRDTPLQHAVDDYVRCTELLAPVSDYLVINASSPNTPGLRDLQQAERLAALLGAVRSSMETAGRARPIFLKIAPDLSKEAQDAIVDIALACGIQGLIATNTTVERPFSHAVSVESGGLSGEPLREMATRAVRHIYRRSGGQLSVVGVGGIFSGADAYEKMRAGASWVQLYTGLIYRGPNAVADILQELEVLLKRDGFRSAIEAIGSDRAPMRPSSL